MEQGRHSWLASWDALEPILATVLDKIEIRTVEWDIQCQYNEQGSEPEL